jgi:hypothetical protein
MWIANLEADCHRGRRCVFVGMAFRLFPVSSQMSAYFQAGWLRLINSPAVDVSVGQFKPPFALAIQSGFLPLLRTSTGRCCKTSQVRLCGWCIRRAWSKP